MKNFNKKKITYDFGFQTNRAKLLFFSNRRQKDQVVDETLQASSYSEHKVKTHFWMCVFDLFFSWTPPRHVLWADVRHDWKPYVPKAVAYLLTNIQICDFRSNYYIENLKHPPKVICPSMRFKYHGEKSKNGAQARAINFKNQKIRR